MQDIKSLLTRVVNSITEAETEVPEKMRRFVMYFHDIHDMVSMYEALGHEAPAYLKRELERCDDRYRHLHEDLNTDGGAFEQVRRDMSKRAGNRWDHSRLLPKGTPQ